MSNPTFRHGPISYQVATAVEQFRLVSIDAEGKVVHATAAGPVFGAVTEKRDAADVMSSKDVAVHYGTAAVKLQVVGGDAAGIKAGAPVFAADDGLAAGSGTVQVGVAARDGADDRVLTVLNGLPNASVPSGA